MENHNLFMRSSAAEYTNHNRNNIMPVAEEVVSNSIIRAAAAAAAPVPVRDTMNLANDEQQEDKGGVSPTKQDFLLCNGLPLDMHPGNLRTKARVEELLRQQQNNLPSPNDPALVVEAFLASLAKQVLTEFRDTQGGRFLELLEGKEDWRVLGEEESLRHLHLGLRTMMRSILGRRANVNSTASGNGKEGGGTERKPQPTSAKSLRARAELAAQAMQQGHPVAPSPSTASKPLQDSEETEDEQSSSDEGGKVDGEKESSPLKKRRSKRKASLTPKARAAASQESGRKRQAAEALFLPPGNPLLVNEMQRNHHQAFHPPKGPPAPKRGRRGSDKKNKQLTAVIYGRQHPIDLPEDAVKGGEKPNLSVVIQEDDMRPEAPRYIRGLPTSRDVLLGRTPVCYNSPGNIFLGELVSARISKYQKASKTEKSIMIRSMMAAVYSRDGRFLKHEPRTGRWMEISREEAKKKVSHLFRDREPNEAAGAGGNGSCGRDDGEDALDDETFLQQAEQHFGQKTGINAPPKSKKSSGRASSSGSGGSGEMKAAASSILALKARTDGSPKTGTSGAQLAQKAAQEMFSAVASASSVEKKAAARRRSTANSGRAVPGPSVAPPRPQVHPGSGPPPPNRTPSNMAYTLAYSDAMTKAAAASSPLQQQRYQAGAPFAMQRQRQRPGGPLVMQGPHLQGPPMQGPPMQGPPSGGPPPPNRGAPASAAVQHRLLSQTMHPPNNPAHPQHRPLPLPGALPPPAAGAPPPGPLRPSGAPPSAQIVAAAAAAVQQQHQQTPNGLSYSCPVHPIVTLSMARQFHMGTKILHPLCPLCLDARIKSKSNPAPARELGILSNHYRGLLDRIGDRKRRLKKLVREIDEIKGMAAGGSLDPADAEDLAGIIEKSLPVIMELSAEDEPTEGPDLVSQLINLRADVNIFRNKIGEHLSVPEVVHNVMLALTSVFVILNQVGCQVKLGRVVEDRFSFLYEVEATVEDLYVTKKALRNMNGVRAGTLRECRRAIRTLTEVEDAIASTVLADAGANVVPPNQQQQRQQEQQRQQLQQLQQREALAVAQAKSNANQVIQAPAANKLPNRKDIIPQVLQAMKQSPNDMETQVTGLRELFELLANVGNRKIVAASGGIELVLNAMRNHATGEEVQRLGCLVVGNLSTNNAENRVAIAAARGIQEVLTAMRDNGKDPAVQVNGCYALGSLAENNAENKVTIAALGGIELVLGAIKEHPSNAQIQLAGCNTLGNLAFQNAENQLSIAALGGIQTIVGVMRGHHNADDVQQYCLAALGRLIASCPDNAATLVSADGVEEILSAMVKRRTHRLVQENACIALGHLAECGDKYRSKLNELGAEDLIKTAQSQNASEAKKWALTQLTNAK